MKDLNTRHSPVSIIFPNLFLDIESLVENISRSVFEECFDAQRYSNDCHHPSLNEEVPGLWGNSRLEDSDNATGHIALNSRYETHMTTSFTDSEEHSSLCEDSVLSTDHNSSDYRPDMLAHNTHGLLERRDSTGVSESTSESTSVTCDAYSSDSDSAPAALRAELEDIPGWRGTDLQTFLSDFVEAITLLVLSVAPAALFRFRRAIAENLKRIRTRTASNLSWIGPYATHTLAILRAFLVRLAGSRANFHLRVHTHLNVLSMPHYRPIFWRGWLSSLWTPFRLSDINFAPSQGSYWIILGFLPILHPRFWTTKQCLSGFLCKLCNWQWFFLLVPFLAITAAYYCIESSEDMAFYDLNGEMLPRHIRLQFQPSNTPT